jgi:hypothetical protein
MMGTSKHKSSRNDRQLHQHLSTGYREGVDVGSSGVGGG